MNAAPTTLFPTKAPNAEAVNARTETSKDQNETSAAAPH
jgi:hypothetical protein